MAKSRDDRYDGAKEVAAALREALAGAGAPTVGGAPQTILAPGIATTANAEDVGAAGSTGATSDAAAEAISAASTSDGTAGAAVATVAGEGAPPDGSAAPTSTRQPRAAPNRSVLIASGIAGAFAIALIVALALLLTGGNGENSAGGGGATTSTTPTSGAGHADTLLAVLAPSQLAKECTTKSVPNTDAVETDTCVPPANAPTSTPNDLELDFYASGQALEQSYKAAQNGLTPTRCGAAQGERVWFHPTGKRGGRRICLDRLAGPLRHRLDAREASGRRITSTWSESPGSPDARRRPSRAGGAR